MRPGYDAEHDGWWQSVDDRLAVLLGAAAVVGVWQGSRAVLPLLLVAVAVGAVGRRVDVAVLLVALVSVGAVLGDAAWRSVAPDALGPYRGWATVRGDPEPAGRPRAAPARTRPSHPFGRKATSRSGFVSRRGGSAAPV
jgi:hypothetical protein